MSLLSLVLRNLLRNRRRSLLTILSVATSLCLVGLLLALYYSFFHSERPPASALRLVVRHKVSITNVLPISHGDRIRAVPGVRDAMILQWYGGVYKDARDPRNFFPRFAVEPERFFNIYAEYRLSDEERKAFLADRSGCIVGRPVAERHGFKPGDRVALSGDIFPADLQLTIRGIYDSTRDKENMIFHQEYLRQSLPPGFRDIVGMWIVLADSPEAAPRVAEAIDRMFRTSSDPTKTESERNFELSFLSYLGDVKLILLGVCSALTFTLLFVTANTMAMSVRERSREVGILKTLGFESGAVLTLIIGESVVLAIIGAVAGLCLSAVLCNLMQQASLVFVDLSGLVLAPPVIAACIALAALVGVLSGLGPAWAAARRPILDAIRYVD